MLSTVEADEIADELHRYYWIRAANGNWWTERPDGTRLVVFRRNGTGRYAYCINRPGHRAVFSLPLYDTEQEAKDAAMAAASGRDDDRTTR